jgi:hypothetical protein
MERIPPEVLGVLVFPAYAINRLQDLVDVMVVLEMESNSRFIAEEVDTSQWL